MTKLSSTVHPKLSDAAIEKLQRKRVHTIVQFIDEDSEKLAAAIGLSLKEILEIKRSVIKKYGGKVKNALDLFEIERANIISTDITSLDDLLKGGFYSGQIYEICGISSSGKTQLCLTLAANVAATNPNYVVRYIDTKRDFSGSRIEQILSKQNYDQQVINQALDHIKVCCVYNWNQLFEVLHWLRVALKKEEEDCRTRMIIIDSLPAIIFNYSKGSKVTIALNHLANICYFIANEFHLSIITVNLITQWSTNIEGGSSSTQCSNVIPTLGKYWAHVPNTRLLLEKIGLGNRKISIWKSHQLKENLACNLVIADCGVICR